MEIWSVTWPYIWGCLQVLMYSWQNIQQASNFDRIFHIKLDNKQMRLIYSMVNGSDADGAAWPTKWVAFSPWIQWNRPILSCSHPVFVSQYFVIKVGLWGLTPLSTIFQLYSGSFFVNNHTFSSIFMSKMQGLMFNILFQARWLHPF